MNKLAKKLTCFYIKKGNIEAENTEEYEYIFEVFLATLINFIILTVLMILTGTYIVFEK